MDKFQDPALQERLREFHKTMGRLTTVDASRVRFQLLLGLAHDSESGTYRRPEKYMFLGQHVCFQAWLLLTDVSKAWVNRLETCKSRTMVGSAVW